MFHLKVSPGPERVAIIAWLEKQDIYSYTETLEEEDFGDLYGSTQYESFTEHESAACLNIYLDDLSQLKVLKESLESQWPGVRATLMDLSQVDWTEKWKEHFPPVETERFYVHPPWVTEIPPGRISICIDPSMAFGTGQHETTRLCLRAIESLNLVPSRILDVGTGSGILAIAAKKLWPHAQIIACDIEEDAIRLAKEAAKQHSTEISFYIGSITEETPPGVFDLVLANIQLPVILPMMNVLSKKTSQVLLISGIVASPSDEEKLITTSAQQHGFTLPPRISRERGWSSLVFCRF